MKRSNVLSAVALMLGASLWSCDSGKSTDSNEEAATLDPPAFNPVGGTYSGAQTVSISSPANGASIHYTTDGTPPTSSSPLYTAPITVSTSKTIKAIAVKSGLPNSPVSTATYTINGGSSSDAVPWNSSITYGSLTDSRDGKAYKTVTIGTQTWMAENLNYAGASGAVGVCYDNSIANCTQYGRLYTWAEAMALSSRYNSNTWPGSGVQQGICPSGWHVPSDGEWTVLTTYIGGESTAGTKLMSTSGWTNGGNGTDAYGFRVLPAGDVDYVGSFEYVGSYANFWSSSEFDAIHAWYRYFTVGIDFVSRIYKAKSYGFSLRCLEN